ncbi:MAG: 50S ribosomal protein L15 [Gemmatimonadota bacterium]
MGLENLPPPKGSKKSSKRLGRGPGSGVGKTSGRGHKGQKARSGGRVPVWFEGGQMPIYRRLPKRGFHSPNRTEYQVVNVGSLEKVEAEELNPERLAELGLVRSADDRVKILGDGELTRALTVRAHAFSGSAREKIEAAGGTVEVIG